jgi:twitching motility two-component system response regulator PilH
MMAVFDLFKRLVSQDTGTGERRADDRMRATLGARVLVVDDSATIRAVLGKMLMQDGYEVLKAADGETAVEMAQSQFPDLIFLDIVLPGISGFAVLRSLRRDTRTRTTPIVMMSGNQQATEQFYVQRFGADGFVKKPFGRVEVFQAVRSLVQAGRMPAREIMPAPPAGIPEDMSPEEWAAIPDVAMPDDDHVASGPALPGNAPLAQAPATDVQASPSTGSPVPEVDPTPSPVAATDRPASRRDTAFAGAAFSMAMRPTVVTGVRATAGPRITVHVARPHETVAGAAGASADGRAARGGEGDEA